MYIKYKQDKETEYTKEQVKELDEKLGDLKKCKKNKLNTKSLQMLLEAGAFYPASPEYLPTIEEQIKHFKFIVQPPDELIPLFKKWHTMESVGKGSNVVSVTGYITHLEEKKTRTMKDYVKVKLYNPINRKNYDIQVWQEAFRNHRGRDGNQNKGFKEQGFEIGDPVVFKIQLSNTNTFLSYMSGRNLNEFLEKENN